MIPFLRTLQPNDGSAPQHYTEWPRFIHNVNRRHPHEDDIEAQPYQLTSWIRETIETSAGVQATLPQGAVIPPRSVWLTPLLGDVLPHTQSLAVEIVSAGADRTPSSDGRRPSIGVVAERFATMILESSSNGPALVTIRQDETAEDDWFVWFLYLTAIVTEFYFTAMSLAPRPLGESVMEEAPFPAGYRSETKLIDLRDLVRFALDGLNTSLVDPRSRAELDKEVLEPVSDSFGGAIPAIPSIAMVRLLTEVSRHHLNLRAHSEPHTWSDILTREAFTGRRIRHRGGRPRPTRDDFKASSVGASTATCTSLHRTCARTIAMQALTRRLSSGPFIPPTGLAYSTALDTCVESALAELQSVDYFLSVAPYAIYSDRSDEPPLWVMWFGKLISRSEGQHMDTEWILLSGRRTSKHSVVDLANVPCVVHLLGCPTLGTPLLETFKEQLEDTFLIPGDQVNGIAPIALLEEHVATMLGFVDIYLAHLADQRLGLPAWLTAAPGGLNASYDRFILGFGGQVSDSMVRQRIVHALAIPRLTRLQRQRPRSGLIQTDVDDEVACRLLHWHGFDTISASRLPLEDYLESYSSGLEAACERATSADAVIGRQVRREGRP